MKKYGRLFLAEYQGEVLAGIVFLEGKNTVEAWLGATVRLDTEKEKRTLAGYANRLIEWEAIKHYKERGFKEYDLGGIWPEEEASKDPNKMGVNNFKLKFGGEVVTRYYYQKIYSKPLSFLYRIYNLKNGGTRA